MSEKNIFFVKNCSENMFKISTKYLMTLYRPFKLQPTETEHNCICIAFQLNFRCFSRTNPDVFRRMGCNAKWFNVWHFHTRVIPQHQIHNSWGNGRVFCSVSNFKMKNKTFTNQSLLNPTPAGWLVEHDFPAGPHINECIISLRFNLYVPWTGSVPAVALQDRTPP